MQDWSAATLAPFDSPVQPHMFTGLAFLNIFVGLFFVSLLFIYELNASKSSPRSLLKEIPLAIPASAFLGFGTIFLFSAIGIHV
ncbi:hypothetical protein HDU98_008255 [Podochytrium sp. JEL0797]|nr:hypothetical protein HDU98_008255 [Podochytrium sp. JEL0797]